jgi:hypothetical protein
MPEGDPRSAGAARGPATRTLLGGLAALLIAAPGAVCAPIQVTQRPPDPSLVDASGDPNEAGLGVLIAEVERRRGLRFVRRPALALASESDPRLPPLLAEARALAPCRTAPAPAGAPAGSCFADARGAQIVCATPPDLEEARRALSRLLDAQRYPRLARAAAEARGDPGIAARVLLAASAAGATARAEGGAEPGASDLLDRDALAVEREVDAEASCVSIGAQFLAVQSDPEAAFRNPPLSTKQMVSPKRYRAGERPALLVGAPLLKAGCAVAGDESVGVARLLTGALAKGGSVPGRTLASWDGDRAVRLACDDRSAPWVYVVEVSDAAHAAAFAAAIPHLLPADFAPPFDVRTRGRRVAAFAGVDAARAETWAGALASEPLTRLPGLE